jgi:quercetin dioxygenase-like cupin family protein
VSLTIEALEQFVAELARTPESWRHLVRDASDERVYEQIWDDEDVNAWVICWGEDQDTGFHDHDESAAGIAVIRGEVCEQRLRVGASPQTRVFGPGSTFGVPAVAIHRVLHNGETPAVTIHAYSPPLVRTGAYRTGPEGELEREILSIEDELRAEPAIS